MLKFKQDLSEFMIILIPTSFMIHTLDILWKSVE